MASVPPAWAGCRTSFCTEVVRERSGQASVEAAILLPAVMALLVLLLQPACLLYTRTVMRAAAASTVRAAMSAPAGGGTDDAYVAYALRRLAAVPQLDIFHIGGTAGWDVELGRGQGSASCDISTRVRPLPLLGMALGDSLELSVHVEQASRPAWLGGDYHGWTSIWGA